MNQSERRYDIFISYSSKDQKLIDALCHFLEARNLRCFVAYRDVPKGKDWASYIVKAIRKCKVFVYVHSQSSNTSEETTRELNLAFGANCVVIPFRIENVDYIEDKEYRLTNVNWLDAFPDKPEKYFGKLFDIIKPNFPDRIVEYDDKKREELEIEIKRREEERKKKELEEQERRRRERKERREASLKKIKRSFADFGIGVGKVLPWIAGAALCIGLFLWIAPMIKSCINESGTVTETKTIMETNSREPLTLSDFSLEEGQEYETIKQKEKQHVEKQSTDEQIAARQAAERQAMREAEQRKKQTEARKAAEQNAKQEAAAKKAAEEKAKQQAAARKAENEKKFEEYKNKGDFYWKMSFDEPDNATYKAKAKEFYRKALQYKEDKVSRTRYNGL